MSLDIKNAVKMTDYTFQYETAAAPTLQNCNFELNYGELIAAAGLSGEGKSTLFFSVNGVIPNFTPGKQSGDIFIDGENIRGKKISEIAFKVGSVLQNAESQIVHETVEDEIAFACENMNFSGEEIGRRIHKACHLVGLEPEWETKTLSGGQKQRLITAAALAMGQKILIFDEPFANMDIQGAHELLKLLRQLADSGYAILIIEHRLDLVLPYVDRAVRLSGGKLMPMDIKEAVGEACKESMKFRETGEASYQGGKSKPGAQSSGKQAVLLKFDGTDYCAGEKTILKNINLEIYRGERLVLLGENGCGKTTLLRLAAGLIRPSGGQISQHIIPVKKKKPGPVWFKKVGVVYQNPDYQLFMPTVEEEIFYKAGDKAWAQQMLDAFALKPLLSRHPHSLSEGQKRKLTIAAVLASKPELLLLDEPTVGQDSESLELIMRNLQKLWEENGCTQVVITHDRRCAAAMAQRAVWIKDGSVYKTGGSDVCESFFEKMWEACKA